jgi:hypothetical protein
MVTITITAAVISLIAGIIILIWPRALNIAIAVWLIINGILGLMAGS